MAVEQTLLGKVAIVSGSARGIGAATCIELASRYSLRPLVRRNVSLTECCRGALVIVNYPWPEQRQDAEQVLESIRLSRAAAAEQCELVEADLATLEGPQRLVDETVQLTARKIDILVNNAGIAIMRPLSHIVLSDWNAQIDLNARGMLLLTHSVLSHLAEDSRIVNVSSVGARQGYVGSTIYNGTKSMVESFTRCWAL